MRNEIREIQQRLGITTVLVTHDQTEALSMCDRIAIMREGRLEQVGSPLEIYDHPATSFVAGLVGRINELACSIAQRYGGRRLVHKGKAIQTPAGFPGQVDARAMVWALQVGLRT